jgi:DNA-binding response OmpR family regulator/HPt (histidine-containing phosphotransfer) domain-containing protein
MNETMQAAQELAARRTRERLEVLRRWVEDPDDAATRREAREAAHQLAGSLDMFGAKGGSAVAARLERILDPAIVTGIRDDPALDVAELVRLTAGLTGGATADGVPDTGAIAWRPVERRTVDRGREFAGVRVLAVDDDPAILDDVTEAFTKAGAEVLRATDGREALEIVDHQQVDLVVSDVNMPDVSGFALVRALRSRPDTLALPLVFLTTRGSRDDVVHGLGLGADDYLVKPVDPVELLARARARLARPPSPSAPTDTGTSTGLLSAGAFRRVVARERERSRREGTSGSIAVLRIAEFDALTRRLGRKTAQDAIASSE